MYKVPYGLAVYYVYEISELAELGIVPNPNLHIGAGWFACINCHRMTFHKAYSHCGKADQFLVCDTCKKCCNKFEIRHETKSKTA